MDYRQNPTLSISNLQFGLNTSLHAPITSCLEVLRKKERL